MAGEAARGPHPGTELVGRSAECLALDRLVEDARTGHSPVLVVHGDAGIGKTALLNYAAGQASGLRVAWVAGIEAEMELPFAGVHQLCGPMLDRQTALPPPQRDALDIALGRSSGDAPDRFLVGLAVLGLLSDAAAERPLLCLVDDAQWLDEASRGVIGFVARRLAADSVGFVIAVRNAGDRSGLEGLPELALGGLDQHAARALLARVVQGPLDDRVGERLIAETRGNPLALLELPSQMGSAELAGGFKLPREADLPDHLEGHYLRRIDGLPAASRRLLLLAAADPVGDAALVWRAAETLGIPSEALVAAEGANLLEIGTHVRFRHPLVRSAAYRAAPPDERRLVHERLAEVSDPDRDADRRAWHRALAASQPDEAIAAELERSAVRAQTRGGLASAAAFLERAASMTPEASPRARRELAAAQAKHQAGAPDEALALVTLAEAGPLDELQRARAAVLRAQIAFMTSRDSNAPAQLLRAARQLEPLDVMLARETYLEALMAAQLTGRSVPAAVVEVAEAARSAPAAPAPRALDTLLDAIAVMVSEGHGPAAPLLRAAVEAFRHEEPDADGLRWEWLAEEAAQELWDHEAWYELAAIQLRRVRAAGALTMLPLALHSLICAQIFAGELRAAAALIEDQKNAMEATGTQLAPYGALILAAWRGDEAELTALIDKTLPELVARGEGIGVSTCQWVISVLLNSLGEYEGALTAARQVIDPPRKLDWTINATLAELVEAAVRSGRGELADGALEQLVALTRPSGSSWGLGLEARCRALVSAPETAEPFYREAIDRLGQTTVMPEHARAHLVYGEWLRREGRRRDARGQLQTAHGMFEEMGMRGFAERARRELVATGATPRARRPETRDDLTAQERQIARLARSGLSNPEIAARLFLSPRTVEWHLRKVFAKLGIRSRRDLRSALPNGDAATMPA